MSQIVKFKSKRRQSTGDSMLDEYLADLGKLFRNAAKPFWSQHLIPTNPRGTILLREGNVVYVEFRYLW